MWRLWRPELFISEASCGALVPHEVRTNPELSASVAANTRIVALAAKLACGK
jgi:hypothetical protein